MTKESNIVKTKNGFVEKSSGRKIESPIDFIPDHLKKQVKSEIFGSWPTERTVRLLEHVQNLTDILAENGYRIHKLSLHDAKIDLTLSAVSLKQDCKSD